MNTTNIAFRADSSRQIGTGHVMRCLTLAHRLRDRGAQCSFISRALPGAVTKAISDAGFELALLPAPDSAVPDSPTVNATWAGVDWARDAQETRSIVENWRPTWLISDHYAFDKRWEDAVRSGDTKLMAIDDLADRPHSVDLLLDQNKGRLSSDYDGLVPKAAVRLIGPRFALLRPQFVQARSESLARRTDAGLRHIMVSMGGTDADNATVQVLDVLARVGLAKGTAVTVVMGSTAPFLKDVRQHAAKMPFAATVRTDVRDMAQLMLQTDLAIGAAGGTAWERCCLGLPTLMLVLAQNQRAGGQALAEAGAAVLLGEIDSSGWRARLADFLRDDDVLTLLENMSQQARAITDGQGSSRVASKILETSE